MGIYRFILSMAVLFSHVGTTIGGYNVGVIAVISFLILSGLVMTLLIVKYYSQRSSLGGFYLDRAARIFPQYLFVVLLSVVFLSFRQNLPTTWNDCDTSKIALNIIVLPMNLSQIGGCMIVPQAWSLALELTFYLLIPFIIVFVTRPVIRSAICALSFVVFVFAFSNLIDHDTWGYRLLPGVLFLFMTGSALAAPNLYAGNVPLHVLLGCAVLYVLSLMTGAGVGSRSVLLGVLTGIPVIKGLTLVRSTKIDAYFGNLSYGIFLNHFLVFFMLDSLLVVDVSKIWRILILLISTAIMSPLMAALTFPVVEQPALRWRRGFRAGDMTDRNLRPSAKR